MVFQATPGNGVIDNPTIEISHEGLRSILDQIEAELVDSEVYRRTMAGLQTMLGEASSTAQILVKAVGREAVRLTFQQVSKQYKVIPVTSETNQAKQQQFDFSQRVEDNPVEVESHLCVTAVEEVISSVETTKPTTRVHKVIGDTKQSKKLTKTELTQQKVEQEREELLHQIGQELRQAREARSLSLDQLHRQTLVPVHHIEALEVGRLEQLPEDVYIRGFIRRLGFALGLNGVTMAASLPEPDPVKSVVPSWYNSTSVPGFQLSSVHLYLGYTALIAGAVGGLSWMSKQSTPDASVKPQPTTPPQVSASPKADRAQSTNKPGLKSSKTGVKAGKDIAPPEALPF
ncbi:MAG TPA: helix-turn-helix domain-containing protein [Coleofasciculaceae cyanobacterium]|jgi:ribosome-binding protein aMBF1 (putative translation factor)